MQIRLSLSMKSITISSSHGFLDSMKAKAAARHHHLSHRCFFHAVLVLAFLLPFVFILTALVTLEGVNNCSSLYCLGRRFGPRFLGGPDSSVRLVTDLHNILDQVSLEDIPDDLKIPETFDEFLSELKSEQYDAKTFAITLRALMENLDKEAKKSRLAEQLYRHFAAGAVPKGIHCLSLRLTDEYSSNARARRELPPPELLHVLSDSSYYHFVLATDNILAASVVVNSVVSSFSKPEKIVFHVISDKKTYAGMHAWFALNPIPPAIIEVKCVNQFDWLTKENVPILGAMESFHGVRNHYHGSQIVRSDAIDNPWVFASKLQARSPKYISILNHLRMYLPELFPNLEKVLFLDDDVVVQRDLSPLWEIHLSERINGAVETCEGEDAWVMSKRFKNYFNFSHPLIAQNLKPEECAWAYGMNIFDLSAWRKSNIRETYHYWLKENLRSNLTLWKLGTLPPALIAFRGNVHPIDPSWHLLGLGYQEKTHVDSVKKAAVIHYNGQCKPWLEIAFKHLQPFWAKHVNYSNEFVRNCQILESM